MPSEHKPDRSNKQAHKWAVAALISSAWAALFSLGAAAGSPAMPFEGMKAGQVLNVDGLSLVWCPPGRFNMGSPTDERGRMSREGPVDVTLRKGFWIGQTEVTQSQWQRVMGTTPWSGRRYVKNRADCAASWVSWDDAMKFCAKLTQQQQSAGRLPKGWRYTLPSEAQWEYACRAGTTGRYCFGDDEAELSAYAWWGGIAGGGNAKNEQYAHEVGQKKPNAWGLYDTHGNVLEWCADWFTAELPGGTDPQGPSRGSFRVYRGGGWNSAARGCRSAARGGLVPSLRGSRLGFRVAIVPSGA